MSKTYIPLPGKKNESYTRVMAKGETETIKFDLKPIEEDFGAISTVTWTLKAGTASIASETLSSSVASALITTSEVGNSRIEVSFSDGTETTVRTLFIQAREPKAASGMDYGLAL